MRLFRKRREAREAAEAVERLEALANLEATGSPYPPRSYADNLLRFQRAMYDAGFSRRSSFHETGTKVGLGDRLALRWIAWLERTFDRKR